MPLYRRLPKRGFKSFGNKEKKLYAIVNLSKLEEIMESNTQSVPKQVELKLPTLKKVKDKAQSVPKTLDIKLPKLKKVLTPQSKWFNGENNTEKLPKLKLPKLKKIEA